CGRRNHSAAADLSRPRVPGMEVRLRSLSAVDLAPATAGVAPLAVDLDGALIKTDSLHEGLCELARRNPAAVLRLIAKAPRGRAAIKRAVAEAAPIDVASIPFNDEVVAYLRQCKAEGRRIGLFT